MTKDEAVKYHREMWNDIADEIESCKRTFYIPTLKDRWCAEHELDPIASCFACEYNEQFNGFCCDHCLFNQTEMGPLESCCEGYYARCLYAKAWQEQAELARKIANLPVREGV